MNIFEGARRIALIVGWKIGFCVIKIIGWSVRGFVGAPMGKDSRA